MTFEAQFRPIDTPEVAAVRQAMERYGGEEAVFDRLGLGVDELAQSVKFSNYEGTLWEAVEPSLIPEEERPADVPVCPLGDRVQEVYDEGRGGLAAVIKVFEGFRMADPKFKVEISERTVAIAATLKKKTLNATQ